MFFKFDSDATPMEKFVTVFSPVFVAGLFVFMNASAWGIFHNLYQKNVAAAASGFHILGFVLSVAAVVYGIMTGSDSPYVTKNPTANVIITLGLMAVSFCAYAGFSFNG